MFLSRTDQGNDEHNAHDHSGEHAQHDANHARLTELEDQINTLLAVLTVTDDEGSESE